MKNTRLVSALLVRRRYAPRWTLPISLAILLSLNAIGTAAEFRCIEASRYGNLLHIFGGDPIALLGYFGLEKRPPPDTNLCRAMAMTGEIRRGDADALLDKLIQGKGWLAALYVSLEGANIEEELKLAAVVRGFSLKTFFVGEADWPVRYKPDFTDYWGSDMQFSVSAAVQAPADATSLNIGLETYAQRVNRSLPVNACRAVCDRGCATVWAAGVQRSAPPASTAPSAPIPGAPTGVAEDNCTRAAFAAYLDKAPSVLSGFEATPLRGETSHAPPATTGTLREKCGGEIGAVELLEKQLGETVARHARNQFHDVSVEQFKQDSVAARSFLAESETLRRAAARLLQCVARTQEAERLASFEALCGSKCDKQKQSDTFAGTAREFRSMIAGTPTRSPQSEQMTPEKTVGRVTYRRTNDASLTGDITQIRGNEWLATSGRDTHRFCQLARNASAILLYDPSRDLYVRVDLAARKFATRAGALREWQPMYDIVTAEPRPIAAPTESGAGASPQGLSRVGYSSADKKTVGEFKKGSGYEWLEINAQSKNAFCLRSETEREVQLYDNGRDVLLQLDLADRKIRQKQGNRLAWTTIYDIGAIEREAATAACTRLAFRQTADLCNNCTAPPWNGELNRTSGDEWTATFVDGHNKTGVSHWRLTSQTSSEMVLHDASRDIYRRFDLTARKGFLRSGAAGNWTAASDILSTDCR
jgi:hypothetical protein